jgi:endonuclease/exonuclease/phosphatase (EEP) superfamily protein YafD
MNQSPEIAATPATLPVWRRTAGRLAICGAVLLILSVAGNLTADWWWLCDLTVHFQWQSAWVALLALAGALAGKRSRIAAWAMFALLWHGSHLVPLWLPTGKPTTPGKPFKVMAFNVYAHNRDQDAVLKLIRQEQPDILCVEELTTFWDRAIRPEFRYRAARPNEGGFGGGIYSRFPISDIEEVVLSDANLAVQAKIKLPQGTVTVLVVHPMPCVGAQATSLRNRQIRSITAQASKLEGPLLVMGDFNSSPWTTPMRELEEQTRLRNSLRGHGLQTTWPSSNFLLTVPIDHIYHTPEITVLQRWTGPSCGSDHYPVIANCQLQ